MSLSTSLKLVGDHLTQVAARSLSTTSQCSYRKRYRSMIGASMEPIHGAPDYSYRDGRPVPLGHNNRRRHERQRELAADCLRMLGELEQAQRSHAARQAAQAEGRQTTLAAKLRRGDLRLDPQALRGE